MRIDRIASTVALLLCAVSLVRAQDAPSSAGPETQVRSIAFRFEDTQSIPEKELRQQIALTDRGRLIWLRQLIGLLPFIKPIGEHRFDPVELQRDVARLRQHYQNAGFPHVDVRYDLRYNAQKDLIDIKLLINEGPPLLVRSLEFILAQDSSSNLPSELQSGWRNFVSGERKAAGRYGEAEQLGLTDRTTRWFWNRGYPFAHADVTAVVDTQANRADVTVRIDESTRARIGAIEVSGNQSVPPRQLVRQLPVKPGDWYSASRLEQGRRQLVQLDIVRHALFEVPTEQAGDSSVALTLRVAENPRRLIVGDVGFSSDGATAQAEWSNRNFLGGVRTLTVVAVAQTGFLAFEDPPQTRYRLSPTVFQPYVGDRRLSASGGPFMEYRDDLRDQSWAVGIEGSMVYAVRPLRSLSLGYTLSRRRVLNYRVGDSLAGVSFLERVGVVPPGAAELLDDVILRSTVQLTASYGWLDDLANPRSGYVLRPRAEITVPGGLNTNEYLLLDLTGSAFLPLTRRIGFATRFAAGRIFPYAGSLPKPGEAPYFALQGLRDVVFTAGGTRDVRGWGSQLVGPKLPEARVQTVNGVDVLVADRYTATGGLARVSGTIELRLPLPGFSPSWQSFLFLDGGRVWTPDTRFRSSPDPIGQQEYFASTGAGLSFQTVVGAVQVALGYKLNPSAFDLRDPAKVLNAQLQGQPVESVPEEGRRRLHLHFAIGATF